MPRHPTCLCGICPKCKRREYARRWYQSKTPEQRRAMVEARDPEKVRAADRARYYRDTQKRRAANDAYAKRNPEKVTEAKKRWRKENKHKISAQSKARRAMLSGDITKQPCEICGEEKAQMHHDDYSRPLSVRWLCAEHHGQMHRRGL